MTGEAERPVDGPVVTLLVAAGVFAFWLGLQLLVATALFGLFGTLTDFGVSTVVMLLVSSPLAVGLLLVIAIWREGRVAWRRRLGFDFEPSTWKPTLLLSALTILTVLAGEALRLGLGRPAVPEFVRDAWATSGPVPLFVIAFVVLPPLFEESLFRGWLIPGLAASRLGTVGAVVLSSILFAAVHLQYDWIDMAVVFAMGLALGGTRVATDSVLPPMVLHGLINGSAVVQVAVTS